LLEEAKDIARKMTYLELSTNPGFMDHYMAAMFFPHTNLEEFPSVREKLQSIRAMQGA
jgi:uncharacterized 2Fe-2S/4Fe-4S cluster protein (DUF4445 family)